MYSVQDPSLDVVLLMTPYFVKMVQFYCLTHRFSQPSPSCTRAVWHSWITGTIASTIVTVSHTWGPGKKKLQWHHRSGM